jgi:hypothetical protein
MQTAAETESASMTQLHKSIGRIVHGNFHVAAVAELELPSSERKGTPSDR